MTNDRNLLLCKQLTSKNFERSDEVWWTFALVKVIKYDKLVNLFKEGMAF